MIVIASNSRIGRKGVRSIVFHPKRGCVANTATKVLKPGNSHRFKFVASTSVELGHKHLLLRNRVAEWRCDVLLPEVWQDIDRRGLLVSERILILVDKDVVDELVVGHGRVVEHLVLVHQVDNILWLDVAKTDEELTVMTWESLFIDS